MSGRLLFMLTLWMAISVALLSALTPLGPPSSKITGSAFNPATTDVVLKARALSIPPGERVSAPGDNDSIAPVTSVIQWLVFATAILVVAWLLRPLPVASPAITQRVQRHFPNGFHARAPPALI
ncbi:hypothetical protein FIM10_07080 [Sphingomonadales bacterium 56]|uniref:Uncharacterized protein n=1 Tax=Sphingobium agri TaxID=2933566 RepID=A0ABT0E2A3_9SPHN|nr:MULTISPECIES: hypothetical protein [Sphingobium]MBY2928434.1 hypothetical protein [Sphingomonadales bacterium 56]MBY2959718.1 hypothetical protein [Sphingomonadales bacterium 58]MCK0533448.1 hypothetical protein [Sphingobium agri]CAD7337297.1 hypothetical protein SPHS6_01430 [Sphingobium sp. S6]CAD7339561.1 hypothetical protein SPHS8_02682 [Sphingobium sp. S8]